MQHTTTYLKPADVAELLGVSQRTLSRWHALRVGPGRAKVGRKVLYGTVQRALRGLSTDGLIDRRRGSGSVVVDLDGRLSDPWHIRYLAPENSPDEYLELHTRIVSREEVFEQGPWNEELGETGGSVIKIDRIF